MATHHHHPQWLAQFEGGWQEMHDINTTPGPKLAVCVVPLATDELTVVFHAGSTVERHRGWSAACATSLIGPRSLIDGGCSEAIGAVLPDAVCEGPFLARI